MRMFKWGEKNEDGEGCKTQNDLYESHAYCTTFLQRDAGQPKMLGAPVLVFQTCLFSSFRCVQ